MMKCTDWLAGALIALTGMLTPAVSAAQSKVEARGGNIFLLSGGAEGKQLTNSSRDSRPVLSPDGRWIVFVRALPGKKIGTGSGDIDAEELWPIRANGKEPTLLVASRQAEDMRRVIANFEDVQFSSDGRLVFFVTNGYATSGAVHVVNTTNRKEHFVVAGKWTGSDSLRGVPRLPAGWATPLLSERRFVRLNLALSP